MIRYLIEFIGTSFLILTIGLDQCFQRANASIVVLDEPVAWIP